MTTSPDANAQVLQAIQVSPHDNVCVAIVNISSLTTINLNETSLAVVDDISAGHKIALVDIAKGDHIYKYGYSIGVSTENISKGQHVHSHNLATNLDGSETYHYDREPLEQPTESIMPTFEGYVRDNGAIGIRNELWVINTVGCVNQTAKKIVDTCKRQYFGQIDDCIAIIHPYGCSQLGDDLSKTKKLLSSLMMHGNAGGVLIIGLGCENNQLSSLIADTMGLDPARLRYFNSQEVEDEIEVGLNHAQTLIQAMLKDKRQTLPVSKLTLGMKCGGSDGFSGLTANPIVGRVTNMLTQLGGRVILTETPEMFGAEQVLMDRANNIETFEQIEKLVNDFKQYFINNNQPIYENPSPGNKVGGLTTLEEKSLGAIQKGGSAIINEVIDYGFRASNTKGLTLLQSPGNDAVSSTALAAAGAHVILFTTGRGTPLGFPVPTVKISSNSSIAQRKKHWIDFNAGDILDGNLTIDQCANELFSLIIEVASGKRTNNEINDNREVAIWKNGVTL